MSVVLSECRRLLNPHGMVNNVNGYHAKITVFAPEEISQATTRLAGDHAALPSETCSLLRCASKQPDAGPGSSSMFWQWQMPQGGGGEECKMQWSF
ncbi:hypothetical protein M404DRAFT_739670 [Pisolithus tinctorius Marx 270]|uniref:Uncharacterized protein n=1 Tax=Pisolithus tinctorius Marx 270 TaxID=870435 RepID=A0A0C3P0J0_PISTI|nr:hypothetical protein M404DRAFT_739670 [Pisolithus tinctorius Marx 270]